MVHKVLFWGGFGLAVRVWQLGLEMRPFFNKGSLWAYPLFGGVGASFGYWLTGVEERQQAILGARRTSLLEKRARRAEREAAEVEP
ncbi:probable NADH2 dehydrogenase (ubiquinone) 14K chain [Phialocephala subalpina]|uniref:Probable NADH2 dehydrogenase (Ubiquinone) 14K chain n=1 Tax=Phialocephala subalpina TaxID=576137 RepID=A0A1L7WWV6_9HELO|nr:probable NADH2 dehydrogenase (ubiquinone) 14K chain [Phialocephala subalpina]